MANTERGRLFRRAANLMPGGVNSPVRAFKAVGGEPIFVKEAKGARLLGEDGRWYVDYIASWGPMILGHAHPAVVEALCDAVRRGTSFGVPTDAESDLAELIQELVPSMERMRLVSSGTEAVMGALRAARGFTGRDLVLKFQGNYHGGADYLLVQAGSGAATLGVPTSAGVPQDIAKTTIVLPYNDPEAVEALFAEKGDQIAAVILEPVVGNMGCVPPQPGYLAALKEICHASGALLVFDEVMTGFRVALGGAQARYGVLPDLSCFGKIVGGGLPVGAYGGRRDIMECVAPLGPVYQAGTLSGNPLAVAAGLATLGQLRDNPGIYDELELAGGRLEAMLLAGAREAGVTVHVQRVGSMLTPFFRAGEVREWSDAAACDTELFGRWHQALLAEGVYWPPAQYEAAFIGTAHDADILAESEGAIRRAFQALRD